MPEVSFEAVYLESAAAAGSGVLVRQEGGCLCFRPPGRGSAVFWPMEKLVAEPVIGSNFKWYIHSGNETYPRLLTETPLPGLMKPGKGAFSTFGLPLAAIVSLLAGAVVLLVLFLFYGLPELADAAAKKLPKSWEDSIGVKLERETLSREKCDSARTKILRTLLAGADFTDPTSGITFKPRFYVIENESFNAFALPGGSIFIHTGALKEIQSLPELMALAGHENGHVQRRHALRQMVRTAGLFGLFSLLAGDIAGVSSVLIQNAGDLQSLSYSRDFEREADLASADFLCRNRYPLSGLADLMKILQARHPDKENFPLLSSHPMSSERLENAQKRSRKPGCEIRSEDKRLLDLFQLLKTNHP